MHMAQLMPLPLTVSCFSKIQIDFTFLVPAHPGSPGKRAVNGCVCVGCHYFPPGPQLPSQPLRRLLPILLLGEQRHNGCEQFA